MEEWTKREGGISTHLQVEAEEPAPQSMGLGWPAANAIGRGWWDIADVIGGDGIPLEL